MVKESQFASVALPHLDAALNLAHWLTGNRSDAEDIVQEAMVRALTYFPSFRGESARGWILTIVRTTAYAALKARRGERVVLEYAGETGELEEVPDHADDPESMLIRSTELNRIDGMVERLPLELRETLVLRELEELSYREIAQVTAAPIGTVMSRLWRARQLLAKAYKGDERP